MSHANCKRAWFAYPHNCAFISSDDFIAMNIASCVGEGVKDFIIVIYGK